MRLLLDTHILLWAAGKDGRLSPVTGVHAAAISALPPIHQDPFDRLLLAQAICEGITLVTADETLASYPGPLRKV